MYVSLQKHLALSPCSEIFLNPLLFSIVKKAEQENRDKIENQTKKEIEGISFAKMNKLDSVYRNYMTEYFQREVINKNKSLYIDFYYKVQELVY